MGCLRRYVYNRGSKDGQLWEDAGVGAFLASSIIVLKSRQLPASCLQEWNTGLLFMKSALELLMGATNASSLLGCLGPSHSLSSSPSPPTHPSYMPHLLPLSVVYLSDHPFKSPPRRQGSQLPSSALCPLILTPGPANSCAGSP